MNLSALARLDIYTIYRCVNRVNIYDINSKVNRPFLYVCLCVFIWRYTVAIHPTKQYYWPWSRTNTHPNLVKCGCFFCSPSGGTEHLWLRLLYCGGKLFSKSDQLAQSARWHGGHGINCVDTRTYTSSASNSVNVLVQFRTCPLSFLTAFLASPKMDWIHIQHTLFFFVEQVNSILAFQVRYLSLKAGKTGTLISLTLKEGK